MGLKPKKKKILEGALNKPILNQPPTTVVEDE